jgi:hypothetical protein
MTTEMALHLASVVVEAEVLNVLKLLKPITFLVSFDEIRSKYCSAFIQPQYNVLTVSSASSLR